MLVYHFRLPSLFLRYAVSVALDPPFTHGFTRQSYTPKAVGVRITVAVDETVIRLNDDQYWLSAAVHTGNCSRVHC